MNKYHSNEMQRNININLAVKSNYYFSQLIINYTDTHSDTLSLYL